MKHPKISFTDNDQLALRVGGWRVNLAEADRAFAGGIVATVKATGRWSVAQKGETIAIGAGETPVLAALEALHAAETLKARVILAQNA